ncbi:MAG: carbohydrate ABC transporter permease [Fidelibacterota bacterium]
MITNLNVINRDRLKSRLRKKRVMGTLGRFGIYIFLLLLALSMLIPFIWMISTSFMDDLEIYSYPPKFIPQKFLWRNYLEAMTILPFKRFFLNSVIISAGAVLGQLLFCSLAAYAFARLRFRWRDKIFALYLSTMMIPGIITLIPAFLIINAFGWMNTYWALITPMVTSVWGIFLLRQFFMTLPRELEDAAKIDGASEFTIYWRIVLPLSKPALATLAIFSFMGSWKDFLWPLIVTNKMEMRPVEVGIAMFHSIYSTNWPYQMAAAVVVMIPIVIVFFMAQRYFIKGITLTGLKG